MNIEKVWERYSEDGNQADRNTLVTHYMGLVDKIAGYVGSSLPASVEVDELVSSGYFGLIDAVDRFDPDRGFKFETFASPRIRGAMLDYLRGVDWAPRSLRAKVREIKQKREDLTATLSREPSDHEIAESLGWTVGQVEGVESKRARSYTLSIEAEDERKESYIGKSSQSSIDIMPSGGSLEDSFNFEALMVSLEDAIHGLADKERFVFTLFYFEGASLAEIGKVLNVTESRVCQILTQAALNCRSHLDLTH